MGKKVKNTLSSFEEDCIWMSYRYCIGRSTIAAHCHAGEIAGFAYDKLSKERMQFMSEDICNEIYDKLRWNNFIDMGWYGNIPKSHFKPLDVVYSILKQESIDSYEKMRSIKTIRIEWDREKNKFTHSVYYFNDDDKDKNYNINKDSLFDLEVWQRLANLFDKDSHKWCRLIDDTVVEYYDYWDHYHIDGKLGFRKLRVPVSKNSFTPLSCIPDESVKEDNIEPI